MSTPHPYYTPRSRFRFWLAGIICFFVFLYLVRSILLPFVVGMLAAYFLDPAVRKLRSRGWSRGTAAAVITVSFFVIAATLCAILIPLMLHQLTALATELPGYVHALQEKYGSKIEHYFSSLSPEQIDPIKNASSSIGASVTEMMGTILPSMLQSSLAILNMFSLIFLTPVVVFYLLRDWNQFVRRFDDMLPRDHAATIRQLLHEIDLTLSGFIRGQTNVCIMLAAYYGVALTLLGLNSGLGLGILTGFMLFIPYVGYAVGLILGVTIGLFQFGWSTQFIALLTIFGVGMVMENAVITPRLVGSKVNLHPIWIIFGILAGAALFGFVGVLISLPVTAVSGVLVRWALAKYKQSTLYTGQRHIES